LPEIIAGFVPTISDIVLAVPVCVTFGKETTRMVEDREQIHLMKNPFQSLPRGGTIAVIKRKGIRQVQKVIFQHCPAELIAHAKRPFPANQLVSCGEKRLFLIVQTLTKSGGDHKIKLGDGNFDKNGIGALDDGKHAGDKGLKGDERKTFMRNCLSTAKKAQQDKMTACNKDAGTKGLKGDERKTFMKSCLSA